MWRQKESSAFTTCAPFMEGILARFVLNNHDLVRLNTNEFPDFQDLVLRFWNEHALLLYQPLLSCLFRLDEHSSVIIDLNCFQDLSEVFAWEQVLGRGRKNDLLPLFYTNLTRGNVQQLNVLIAV